MPNTEQFENNHISVDCYIVEHHTTMTHITGNTAYDIMSTFRIKQSHFTNFTKKNLTSFFCLLH